METRHRPDKERPVSSDHCNFLFESHRCNNGPGFFICLIECQRLKHRFFLCRRLPFELAAGEHQQHKTSVNKSRPHTASVVIFLKSFFQFYNIARIFLKRNILSACLRHQGRSASRAGLIPLIIFQGTDEHPLPACLLFLLLPVRDRRLRIPGTDTAERSTAVQPPEKYPATASALHRHRR